MKEDLQMSKLEKAKEIIKENYEDGNCGIFSTRNWCGDPMATIFDEDGLTIDICYHYSYFEVFGLSDAEFKELEKYYEKLGRKGNR